MEPILHRFPELIERNTGTDLDFAFGNWKRIVEHAEVGEAAHRKRVEPLQGTRFVSPILAILDVNFAREHSLIKAYASSIAEYANAQL